MAYRERFTVYRHSHTVAFTLERIKGFYLEVDSPVPTNYLIYLEVDSRGPYSSDRLFPHRWEQLKPVNEKFLREFLTCSVSNALFPCVACCVTGYRECLADGLEFPITPTLSNISGNIYPHHPTSPHFHPPMNTTTTPRLPQFTVIVYAPHGNYVEAERYTVVAASQERAAEIARANHPDCWVARGALGLTVFATPRNSR